MRPYIRYCSCNHLRSVHDVIWLGVTAVRMEQIFWRDWLLTRQKEIISLLHFVSALFVFWSQLTNLFVRNFKQTPFFSVSETLWCFSGYKGCFSSWYRYREWLMFERGQTSQGLVQINARKPPERHVNKRDDLFCLSDFVFLFLVMVNS